MTIEADQKRLHVTKRGYRDTNIPVNPDEFVSNEALTVKLKKDKEKAEEEQTFQTKTDSSQSEVLQTTSGLSVEDY